jgi:hypothetical protein
LCHNLAVTCWIIANGFWIICEFFWEDLDYLRYYTAFPFSLGLLCVLYYYVSELRLKVKSGDKPNAPAPSSEETLPPAE